MKKKTGTELLADCHEGLQVNLVLAQAFISMFNCLKSVMNLEQRHEIQTAISAEGFPGVMQIELQYIERCGEAFEVKNILTQSELYQ